MNRYLPILWILLGVAGVAAGDRPDPLETPLTITYAYPAGSQDSPATARALALFGARREAVREAAARFQDHDRVALYGDRHYEIFCLATDEIESHILAESFSETTRIYRVMLTARVTAGDFLRAEMRDAQLENEERHFSLKEEMEPLITAAPDPAGELSRVYRYRRRQEWRKAIIYLDHLELKYPHWGVVPWLQAEIFEATHQPEAMRAALRKSCADGLAEACRRIAGDPRGE